MGNKTSKLEVKDVKVSTLLGSLGCGGCTSSCCEEQTEEQKKQAEADHKLAEKAREVEMALRYGKAMGEHLLVQAIERIMKETGEVPEIHVLKEGDQTPALSKRALLFRLEEKDSPKNNDTA